MLNLVAISQATTEINKGAESAPPGIECFKSPRSDRVKLLWVVPHMIGSFIWRKSALNVTLNPMLLFTGISLAASLSFSPETEEKLDQLLVSTIICTRCSRQSHGSACQNILTLFVTKPIMTKDNYANYGIKMASGIFLIARTFAC